MSISKGDVEHVARLAHLDLSPEEITGLTQDLDAILEYAVCLDAVDTGDIDPAAGAGAEGSRLREDVVAPGLEPGEATAGAPEAEKGLFKVPPAFTEE